MQIKRQRKNQQHKALIRNSGAAVTTNANILHIIVVVVRVLVVDVFTIVGRWSEWALCKIFKICGGET